MRDKYEFKELKPRAALSKITVTTSSSRVTPEQDKYIEYMKAKNLVAGGSGRKVQLCIITDFSRH